MLAVYTALYIQQALQQLLKYDKYGNTISKRYNFFSKNVSKNFH